MPRMKPADKIEALRQKRAQIEAQLQAAEAREKEQARKNDTRRKVIAGALALEHMEKNGNSEFARIMKSLLNEYVRPAERRLFPDLPDLEKTAGDAAAAAAEEITGEASHPHASSGAA